MKERKFVSSFESITKSNEDVKWDKPGALLNGDQSFHSTKQIRLCSLETSFAPPILHMTVFDHHMRFC